MIRTAVISVGCADVYALDDAPQTVKVVCTDAVIMAEHWSEFQLFPAANILVCANTVLLSSRIRTAEFVVPVVLRVLKFHSATTI